MKDSQLVLHATAIKKHGTAEAIGGIVGLDPATAEELLKEAASRGRVTETKGRYMLTPPAQMALNGEYSRAFGELRGNEAFIAAYDDFERINVDLKQLITRWQTMTVGGEQVANDHSDKDYDASVIDDLGALHERAEVILERLAAQLPRLSIYRDKLTEALEKAEDGDTAWVSDARSESYHTVWFELHEDLLRITGNKRTE